MSKSRFAVALLSLTLSSAMPSAANADDVCQNPSFIIGQGSPFKVQPKPGVDTQPVGLAAGTYKARPGAQPGRGCGCDLAIAVLNPDNSGFLALMAGNDDGTFTLDQVRNLDGIPVAVATGRFRSNSVADGIAVVTSTQVAFFLPDATGVYPQIPSATFPAGSIPVAITTGDFNGDGFLDAAVVNRGDSSLSILLGTETGSFVPIAPISLRAVPESVTSGKFSATSVADDVAVGVSLDAGGSLQAGLVIVPGSRDAQYTAKSAVAIGQRGSSRSSIFAANLSGPTDSSGQRRWRDLVITFTDVDPTGKAIGRVKVLLGKDGGEIDVGSAQTLDLGDVLPTSIKVVDLDDDGAVDLIVSAHGQSQSTPNGTIHFFKGQMAPVGFQPKQGWNTIPSDTGILPSHLVAGRFGKQSPGQSTASMGIAAINDPGLKSIILFQGNGQGVFTQPSLVTTSLGDNDHLFVSGDFHSANGASPLQDLAFLTKDDNKRNVVRVMQANGAGGFGQPDLSQPPILAGNSPSLMVPGLFDPSKGTGLALIDDTGSVGQKPLLKIFFGQGDGVLKPATELPLPDVGIPGAMVAGHFQSSDTLDLALVSATATSGSSQAGGVLTLLLNKGNNTFEIGSSTPLQFVPAAIATSTRLSGSGRSAVVIRDANAPRFLFLINIDNGGFRPAKGPNLGFFAGAGSMQTLLVGNVAHNGSAMLDDVVTYDEFGGAIQVFVNNGDESFTLKPFNSGIPGGAPPYQLADFGSGLSALAAPTISDGTIGLLLLQADGKGGFTPSTGLVQKQEPKGTLTRTNSTTAHAHQAEPVPKFTDARIQVNETVVAQFRSALLGNSKPDFAVITRRSETDTTAGNCVGDHTRLPHPAPPDVCREILPDDNCGPHGPHPCVSAICCHCTDIRLLPAQRCAATCNSTAPAVPFQPFCQTKLTFTQAVSVFGNTCGN